MLKRTSGLLKTVRAAFTLERVICRLLATWCGYTAYQLMREGEFGKLEYAQNTPVWQILLVIALLFAVYSGVASWLSSYESDSWFLFGGATLCVAQWLLSSRQYENAFLFSAAVMVAYGFFIIYFLQKNRSLWKRWNPKGRTVWMAALAFALLGGSVIAAATCYRYLTFASPNFDFGLFLNMFHHMKETGLPLSTCERDVLLSHFAVHISPIYYVLLPFYMLFPSPLTLQIAQAVVLASGVVPVLLLCRHFRLSGKCTVLVTLIYSLYPALSAGCFYDIHENCFLTPLLLWLFYFFERGQYGWMYLFAFLTLMVKEDAAAYVMIFALYVLLSKKKVRHGCILLVGALVYFGLALWALQAYSDHYAALYANATPNPPIAGPMINRFDNLILHSADGLAGAVKTALVNPGYLLLQLFSTKENGWDKLIYCVQMFLPLGFIPFCTHKPSRWLLLTPILMNLLTDYPYQYSINYQYHFGVAAFLFYVAVTNLPELKAVSRRNVMGFAAAACCCLYLTYALPTLLVRYREWSVNREAFVRMEAMLDTIPEEASVCSSTFLLAHLAEREEIYELKYHDNVGDVDYVVVDTRHGVDDERMAAYLAQGYVVEREQEGLIAILVKGTE